MQCRAMGTQPHGRDKQSCPSCTRRQHLFPRLLFSVRAESWLTDLPSSMDSMRVPGAFCQLLSKASLHKWLSPGLSERMVCRIMSDMVSLR